MHQLQQHKIDLQWCEIGLWLSVKGKCTITTKPILVKYKELEEGEDIIQVGIDKLLGSN